MTLADLNGRLYESFTPSEWWTLLSTKDAFSPRTTRWKGVLRWLRNRWMLWTAIPGDRVSFIQRDLEGVIVDVTPRGMRIALASGQVVARYPDLDIYTYGDRQWFDRRGLGDACRI